MKRSAVPFVTFLILPILFAVPSRAQWAEPQAPAVPGADGYVVIPNAAVPPSKDRTYKVVWDCTKFPSQATDIVTGLNMAGSEINAFAVAGVPMDHVHFVMVFHGEAMDALLDNPHYDYKYQVDNPNLKVIADMKKAGVEFLVCGQNLAFEKIDPKNLTPDVTVASDALIVLMTYQNDGYALMSF